MLAVSGKWMPLRGRVPNHHPRFRGRQILHERAKTGERRVQFVYDELAVNFNYDSLNQKLQEDAQWQLVELITHGS